MTNTALTKGIVTFNPGGHPTVSVRLDDQVPSLTGGVGGFQQVQHPRRDASVEWQGRTPYTLTFGVLFDAWRSGGNLEPDIAVIETLGTPPRDKTGAIIGEPPNFQMSGPLPHTELQWVIDDLTFGEVLVAADDVTRLRQQVTVSLMEYVAPVVFGTLVVPATYALYPIKAGDTAGSVAAHHLGGKQHWRVLATLNPNMKIRHATTKLVAGRQLRRPVKGWKK